MIHQHQHHGENVKCRGAEGKTAGGGVDRLLVDIRVLLYLNRSVIGRGDRNVLCIYYIQESRQPQCRSDKLL